ncbi:MAG: hypothetical protein WDN23_07345 [Edaphobacter sp.]
MHTTKAAIPITREQGSGHIIQFSSVGGDRDASILKRQVGCRRLQTDGPEGFSNNDKFRDERNGQKRFHLLFSPSETGVFTYLCQSRFGVSRLRRWRCRRGLRLR